MKYSLEEIYMLVGREDKTAGLTFRTNSEAHQNYGLFITVEFIYTQKEREELDKRIQDRPLASSGFIKAKALNGDLSPEQIQKLETFGVNSDDIIQILYFKDSTTNTFHSKEKRTIHKIEIPISYSPKGRDLSWMYNFSKKQAMDGIGLCPSERNFYLAGKYYYEPDKITKDEAKEIFIEGLQLKEEIEWEVLRIKYMREEITSEEKNRLVDIIHKKQRLNIELLDKYLIQAGSSLKKLFTENPDQATELYSKLMNFLERRLNIKGNTPIYINIDSYLHIYMRHVEEMKINKHFEDKDNFQWHEEDVFSVMEKVIQKINDELQIFFEKNPGKRYSRHGAQSIYYEGDYYTIHIESNGRISTFHKNKKGHEKK